MGVVRSAALEALGPEAALSKSTASRICQVLKTDFEVFQNRDLTGIDLDYLFLDGSHFKMHDDTNAEPVMLAYTITTVSQPVLVAVEPAAPESTDGSAELINAIGTEFHGSLRQRCLIHRARNVLAKIPTNHQPTINGEF